MKRTTPKVLAIGVALAMAPIPGLPAGSGSGAAIPGSEPPLVQRAGEAERNFRWQEASAIYRAELTENPKNAQAWRGLGRILRWQGRLSESREAYAKAEELEPGNPDGLLGIAASHRLDHAFDEAGTAYEAARKRWPGDDEVLRAVHDFERETSPRVNLFFEEDLSFRLRKLNFALPLLSRKEIQLELQEEERPGAYRRRDAKFAFLHHFGLDQVMELSARKSAYSYLIPTTDFTAIDTFEEYRARYTHPISAEQVLTLKLAYRPTTLKTSGQSFSSKKLEADIRSQWIPRFATVIGGGVLHDLRGSAQSVDDMRTTSLIRLGAEYALTADAQVSATYITNPDLDNTVNSTTLLQANYQLAAAWSALLRYRYDSYKTGFNQRGTYLGFRYSSGSHLWSEVGVKTANRGDKSGIYPLLSIVYRF